MYPIPNAFAYVVKKSEQKLKEISSIELSSILRTVETVLRKSEVINVILYGKEILSRTFSPDLFKDLNLTLRWKGWFRNREVKLDESLFYDSEMRNVMESLIIQKAGYFPSESNYIFLPYGKKPLKQDDSFCMMVGTRVTLVWNGVAISDNKVKRILSLGFTYVLDIISKAQLIHSIALDVNCYEFQISVIGVKKQYVNIEIRSNLPYTL